MICPTRQYHPPNERRAPSQTGVPGHPRTTPRFLSLPEKRPMIGHRLQSIARHHLLPRRSSPLDHHVTRTGTISEPRNWNTLTDSTRMKWLSGSRSTDQRSTRKEGKKGSSRAYYPPVASMRIRRSLTSGSTRTKKMRDVVSGSCQTKNSRLGRC